MKQITWFKNPHEQRNYLLAHGLMRLHKKSQIKFRIADSEQLRDFDISPKLQTHNHRHTVLLLVEDKNLKKWVLVDSEDSFICMSSLIKEVDLYFCAGYNSEFFKGKQNITPLSWQTEDDIVKYRKITNSLIEKFGDYFGKVKKFVPIGPNSISSSQTSFLQRKWINFKDKLSRLIFGQRNWQPMYEMFENRYQAIHNLRQSSLQYDVILADTLWGWPHHRYALHQKLIELANDYKIKSSLKWNKAAESLGLEESQFPLISNPINDNYEFLLSSSKLGVFATGFHWGWRNIMTLALLFGIPIYMDKPILEPYFDFNQFKVFYNEDRWSSLEKYLQEIDDNSWNNIKQYNQKIYDKYLSPEKVASYFVNAISS